MNKPIKTSAYIEINGKALSGILYIGAGHQSRHFWLWAFNGKGIHISDKGNHISKQKAIQAARAFGIIFDI